MPYSRPLKSKRTRAERQPSQTCRIWQGLLLRGTNVAANRDGKCPKPLQIHPAYLAQEVSHRAPPIIGLELPFVDHYECKCQRGHLTSFVVVVGLDLTSIVVVSAFQAWERREDRSGLRFVRCSKRNNEVKAGVRSNLARYFWHGLCVGPPQK